MPRLFVAIDLTEQNRRDLAAVFTGLPAGTRWTPPEQLHLTLNFIGEVAAALLPPIKGVLAEIVFSPFVLRFAGLGCFPDRRHPKILWAGVEKSPDLERLYDQIAQRLEQLGLARETRRFHPHLTLARLAPQVAGESVAGYLARNSRAISISLAVDGFSLYSSQLTRSGAVHHLEGTFAAR